MTPHEHTPIRKAMARRIPALPPDSRARPLAWGATCLGAVLVATAIFLCWSAMRDVMAIGGSCVQGGPYAPSQACPEGSSPWLGLSVPLGLLGLALFVLGAVRVRPRAARLALLGWPALFFSLGWNFLEFGLWPPAPASGPVWGWLLCAALFGGLGGAPLVLAGVIRARMGTASRPWL